MEKKNRGVLAVVSGFSGAGKGTIMKELLAQYPDQYALSVSATTREPRPGETDGQEYFFVSDERFREMIAQEELLEYAGYVNHYYGTPKAYVMEQLDAGKDVILEIEIQGALKIRKKFPDTLLLFISAPDAKTLQERLSGRGTEDEGTVAKRLSRACEESEGIEAYDYFVVNDELGKCVAQVHGIIQNEHARVARNLEKIAQIRAELKAFERR